MLGLLGACAPMKSKNSGENITPLDEAERQTTTDYAQQYDEGLEQDETSKAQANASVDAPGQQGQDAAGADVVEPVLTLEERFGINPYLANPPIVSPDAQAAFSDAMAAVDAQDTEAAVILLEQMTVDYPELSGPAYNMAVLYYQQDKPKEAMAALEKALLANENNFDARNLKAKLHRDNSEFEKAETAYLEIINRWGGYLPAYKNLGIMYDLYMGQPEKALKYYELYNKYSPEEDRQVVGWQMVIERQLKAKQMREQALAAQQQAEQSQPEQAGEQAGGSDAAEAEALDQQAEAASATNAEQDTAVQPSEAETQDEVQPWNSW